MLFVMFLCIVCLTSYMLPRRARYVWLLVCSYAFYLYSTSGMPSEFTLSLPPDFPSGLLDGLPKLLLLIGSTLFSYLCALAIGRAKGQGAKRLFMVVCLVGVLGVLCTFKYADFAVTLAGREFRFNPVLPLGLSYYSLQVVSYTLDVYTGSLPAEKNPLRYALYVCFFPGITIGPINRAGELLPQYKNPAPFAYKRVAGGFFRVLWGIFKKVVIADNLGVFTGGVFRDPSVHPGPVLVLAGLLFCYQLYADFAGCCDIAIGAARMLGFDFMENFNRPFAAKTFNGLWQRWHISLTTFFRDYVFTPLVWSRWTEKLPLIGKKVTKPPMLTSTVLIFLLSGMWHGASWHYAVWGLLNGLIMVGCQKFGKKKDKLVSKIPGYRSPHLRGFVQRVLVYLMFAGCLLFFAFGLFGTPLATWFGQLPTGWDLLGQPSAFFYVLQNDGLSATLLMVLAAGILLVELIEKWGVSATKTMADWIRARWFFVRWPLYFALLAALLCFGAFGASTFIYQQY